MTDSLLIGIFCMLLFISLELLAILCIFILNLRNIRSRISNIEYLIVSFYNYHREKSK